MHVVSYFLNRIFFIGSHGDSVLSQGSNWRDPRSRAKCAGVGFPLHDGLQPVVASRPLQPLRCRSAVLCRRARAHVRPVKDSGQGPGRCRSWRIACEGRSKFYGTNAIRTSFLINTIVAQFALPAGVKLVLHYPRRTFK